jgi:hypothetical protein
MIRFYIKERVYIYIILIESEKKRYFNIQLISSMNFGLLQNADIKTIELLILECFKINLHLPCLNPYLDNRKYQMTGFFRVILLYLCFTFKLRFNIININFIK